MKLPRKSRKKTIVVAVIAACLLAAGGVYAYIATRPATSPNPSDTQTDVKEDQANNKSSQTAGTLPNKTDSNQNTSKQATGTPSGNGADEDTPSKQIEVPRIERAGQSERDVKVVASLQKASSGSCELRLTNAGRTVTRKTSVVLGPSYYTCSFVVAATDLSSGTWSVMVRHLKDGGVASSDMQTVEVSL